MLTAALIEAIEKIAPPSLQAAWDKSGLQVAATRPDISMLGVFLDPLPSAISRALDAGADFLLCHHPLSLKPELPNRDNAYFKALKLLMRANVALYAAHTSLDINLDGPAGWLGQELGLTNCRPLERVGGPESVFGYGHVGDLPEPLAFGKLVNLILTLVKMDCANLAGPACNSLCERVAYCGGSGGSLLACAKESGAQLYVTGDIKYHAALDAEIPVLDVGHHSLEEEMMRRFTLLLAAQLPDIEVAFFPSVAPFRRACQ